MGSLGSLNSICKHVKHHLRLCALVQSHRYSGQGAEWGVETATVWDTRAQYSNTTEILRKHLNRSKANLRCLPEPFWNTPFLWIVADADSQGGQSGRVTSLLMFGEQKHGSKLIWFHKNESCWTLEPANRLKTNCRQPACITVHSSKQI